MTGPGRCSTRCCWRPARRARMASPEMPASAPGWSRRPWVLSRLESDSGESVRLSSTRPANSTASMRLTCTRPFRGRWHCLRVVLLLCMALAAGPLPGPAPAAAAAGVTFSVADSVSAEDASYVREGTAYAQRYVSEMLSDVSDEALIVNVRNS